jgi:hypothetical protein
MEPWSRRHDANIDEHRRALWQAHAKLDEEYKRVGKGLRRSDAEWLVSEDHVRRALAESTQKTAPGTP